jgi:hypothetical protein
MWCFGTSDSEVSACRNTGALDGMAWVGFRVRFGPNPAHNHELPSPSVSLSLIRSPLSPFPLHLHASKSPIAPLWMAERFGNPTIISLLLQQHALPTLPLPQSREPTEFG